MEIQSLTKTFSNGVKVFTREIVQDGVRGTRTTVYNNGKLIRDRFKTITSSTTDSGNKLNIITKHTYGQICGELFEKGTYGVLGRLYNKSGLKKLYEIYTAPTHNRKNKQWCGQITEVVGKHLNIRDDINTAFFYNKNNNMLSNIIMSRCHSEIPTVAHIDSFDKGIIEKMTNQLYLMEL